MFLDNARSRLHLIGIAEMVLVVKGGLGGFAQRRDVRRTFGAELRGRHSQAELGNEGEGGIRDVRGSFQRAATCGGSSERSSGVGISEFYSSLRPLSRHGGRSGAKGADQVSLVKGAHLATGTRIGVAESRGTLDGSLC